MSSDEDAIDISLPTQDEDDEVEEVEAGAEDEAGNTVAVQKPPPSTKKCNDATFYQLCKTMETVWKAGTTKDRSKRWSDSQKLRHLLPPRILQYLDEPFEDGQPETIFPMLRLILPEKDASRNVQLKEATLGKMYQKAFDLAKKSDRSEMLIRYTDPQVVSAEHGCGEFSNVVEHVVGQTKSRSKGSGYTLGQMNQYLDELTGLPLKAQERKEKARMTALKASSPDGKKKKHKKQKKVKTIKSLMDMRAGWLRKLNEGRDGKLGLSPLEHKWLCRILIRNMKLTLGWEKILRWYNPYGDKLWAAHNSLKGICDKLCDPDFSALRTLRSTDNDDEDEQVGVNSYIARSPVDPVFGQVFSPMLSEKTGFGRFLSDISSRHRQYIEKEESLTDANGQEIPHDILSFRHPTLIVEPKLDGERMLAHVSRDGIVKLHTRRGTLYSDKYSPSLGPSIRRALACWDFDVILDGEVLAYNSTSNQILPFGNNGTVANVRRAWLKETGKEDARDRGIDTDIDANKAVPMSTTVNIDIEAGSECWLQYAVFDVIYVDGPKSADFLSGSCAKQQIKSGSLIHVDCYERKKILYKLISEQANEVEIVKSWVVRPTGETVTASEYFNNANPTMESSLAASIVDSQTCVMAGMIPDLLQMDIQRRNGRTDEQIGQMRAFAVQDIYEHKVEQQHLEGLVFKDLCTPYYMGEHSKSMRFWLKFKPDYYNGAVASDLDLVVIGCYYATGLRNQGKPSSFLCACIDSDSDDRFLPMCKVNVNSMDRGKTDSVLFQTKYYGEEGSHGHWFAQSTIPDFVSQKSHQENYQGKGWRYVKRDYPDLWINPENSVIIALNAGEIVTTDIFSAGVTLRFPRIMKLHSDADDKPLKEIESDLSLWDLYKRVQDEQLAGSSVGVDEVSFIGSNARGNKKCRFLTEKQYVDSKKSTRTVRKGAPKICVAREKVSEVESSVLAGIYFAVFDGKYKLAKNSVDMVEAKEQGWFEIGHRTKSAADVKKFILRHSGKNRITAGGKDVFVLGGSKLDARVKTHVNAIKVARSQLDGKPPTNDKARERLEISKQPGVLRWTYVFTLVYQFLNRPDYKEGMTIQSTSPESLSPTVLDYLAQPVDKNEADEAMNFGPKFFDVSLSNPSAMRRAIEFARASNTELQTSSWRTCWKDRFVDPTSEAWVCAGTKTTLWPYRKDRRITADVVVLYPNIYQDLVQASEPWTDSSSSVLASALPIVRVMGATVSDSIHANITHVLCDMKHGVDEVDFEEASPDSFVDATKGADLLSTLNRLDVPVTFVSRRWIFTKFDAAT